MFNLFLRFEDKLADIFGYRFVIHFEDFILFSAGIFLGLMVMAVFGGDVLSKIRKVRQKTLDKLKVINIKKGDKTEYILNAQTLAEFIETFLIIVCKPIFTIKRYTLKDEKRTKIFLAIFITIGVILLILAFISITTIYQENIPY